jgi:hypothetical protein
MSESPGATRATSPAVAESPVGSATVVSLPSYAQLGAALRSASTAAQRFGREHQWRPTPGSKAAAAWSQAADTRDPLQLTLLEADVQAVMLTRSALAHADEVGRAVSTKRAFLPHSVGRICVEHGLRALHLADTDASPEQRAERRLNDLLHAVTEGERQRISFAKKAKLVAGELRDATEALNDVKARAQALGLEVIETKRGRRVGDDGRASTLALAERYLAGSHPGVAEFLVRGHGASVHGIETAFLASAADQVDPVTGINVPSPELHDPSTLALTLMGVPLAVDNAFRAVASRFQWPAQGNAWRTWDKAHGRQLETWATAIDAAPDPTPPVMGMFGA